MPQHEFYLRGQWNATCDVCGRVFKSGELTKAWDESMRCQQCYEVRHPQDFVRGVPDNPSTAWVRKPTLKSPITQVLTDMSPAQVFYLISTALVSQFPSPGVGQFWLGFLNEINNPQKYEVVKVTSYLGSGVYQCVRAQNGTPAQDWNAALRPYTITCTYVNF